MSQSSTLSYCSPALRDSRIFDREDTIDGTYNYLADRFFSDNETSRGRRRDKFKELMSYGETKWVSHPSVANRH